MTTYHQLKKLKAAAALYVRVSTQDKQHPANQTAPLTKWCKEHGYKIVATYIDRESGAEPARPQFQEMLKAAGARKFSIIVCWSLDRFSREGIAATFMYLKRLKESDVQFYSYTEEYFRTTGPAADFLIAITAWVADHERRRRAERIKAGLERAREAGTRIGRRPRRFNPGEVKHMAELFAAGIPLRQIAAKFETSKSSAARKISEYHILKRARRRKTA